MQLSEERNLREEKREKRERKYRNEE